IERTRHAEIADEPDGIQESGEEHGIRGDAVQEDAQAFEHGGLQKSTGAQLGGRPWESTWKQAWKRLRCRRESGKSRRGGAMRSGLLAYRDRVFDVQIAGRVALAAAPALALATGMPRR